MKKKYRHACMHTLSGTISGGSNSKCVCVCVGGGGWGHVPHPSFLYLWVHRRIGRHNHTASHCPAVTYSFTPSKLFCLA